MRLFVSVREDCGTLHIDSIFVCELKDITGQFGS